MRIKSFDSLIINFILYNNLIFFSFATVNNVNLFWLGSCFLLNFFIFFRLNSLNRNLVKLLIVLNLIIFGSLMHLTYKFVSTFFTFFCLVSAILQLSYVNKNLQLFNFRLFVKRTIFLIMIFYLIQALLFILSLPVINVYGSALYNDSILRFNNLFAEPSYASFCVTLLLYLTNSQNTNKPNFSDYLVEFFGFFLILLFSSVIGLFTYFLYILFIQRKYYNMLFKIECTLLFLFILYFSTSFGAIDRIYNSLYVLFTNNTLIDLVAIEPSGAFRIVPTIIYFESFKFSEIVNFLFGFGAGSSEFFLNESLIKYGYGYTPDGKFQGGLIPALLIDYGVIVFVILIYFYFKLTLNKDWVFQVLIVFVLFLNININNQLFWFTFYVLYINKQLLENKKYFETDIC